MVPPKAAATVPEWKSSAQMTPAEESCSRWHVTVDAAGEDVEATGVELPTPGRQSLAERT